MFPHAVWILTNNWNESNYKKRYSGISGSVIWNFISKYYRNKDNMRKKIILILLFYLVCKIAGKSPVVAVNTNSVNNPQQISESCSESAEVWKKLESERLKLISIYLSQDTSTGHFWVMFRKCWKLVFLLIFLYMALFYNYATSKMYSSFQITCVFVSHVSTKQGVSRINNIIYNDAVKFWWQ